MEDGEMTKLRVFLEMEVEPVRIDARQLWFFVEGYRYRVISPKRGQENQNANILDGAPGGSSRKVPLSFLSSSSSYSTSYATSQLHTGLR
jgi:hypothetical protein